MHLVLGPVIVLGLLSVVGCGDTSSSGGGDQGGGTSGDPYVFATDDYTAYTQIDRHAAVEAGTVGISATSGLGMAPIRNDYNASNPEEDAAGMWIDEITQSVTDLHTVLDPDLVTLGLTPATLQEALAQAGPVIVPDTIKYDPDLPTAYPNGRKLTDQVVDITLAAVLLKLGPTQPITTFADLPLNPAANDAEFSADFPYLAPPN